MLRNHFHYAIELIRAERSRLGQVPIPVDWGPALEWARLMALRASRVEMRLHHGDATIEPIWDTMLGEPYVGGIRVLLSRSGTVPCSVELPRAYFSRTAIAAGKKLAAQGLLEAGEKFLYTVVALRAPGGQAPPSRFALTVEETVSPMTLRASSREPLRRNSTVFGLAHDADIPVFIAQQVLDQASALTLEAGPDEAAGVLIGHLCRDPEDRQVFLELTALIPAPHTRAESTRVTFTAETWSAVEAAIRLRRSEEVWCGWFHSHPVKYWCSSGCSPEARRSCPLGRASWFSGDDCTLHSSVFPMAHCVALLTSHAEFGLRHALFAWRQGLITQRGFHVVNARPGMVETASGEAIIGEEYEKTCS